MGGVQPLRNSDINLYLEQSWDHFHNTMIDNRETIEVDGRQVPNPDFGRPYQEMDRNDLDMDGDREEMITVSEVAAYVLLRAVWMNDQETFTRVWNWTQANMQRINIQTWNRNYRSHDPWVEQTAGTRFGLAERSQDHLFAWRYVPSLNGRNSAGGIISYLTRENDLDRNGFDAASDDIEIGVALYFASLRGWGSGAGEQNEFYLEAQAIARDAWDKYVVEVAGQYYFFAGDQFSGSGEINPSYFRMAYFRHVLPAIDNNPGRPWHLVAESSYNIIDQSSTMILNDHSGQGVNLPPNWLRMSYQGVLTDSETFPGVAGEIFGWDAFRTLFAVAQDYAWYSTYQTEENTELENEAARDYLSFSIDDNNRCESTGPICFLRSRLENGRLPGGFSHDGSRVPASRVPQTDGLTGEREQLFSYGGYLPLFYYAQDESNAQSIIQRIRRRWHTYEATNPDGSTETRGYWGSRRSDYYSQNWLWFGLFLVNGHPEADPIINTIRDLPAPAPETACLPETAYLDPGLLQINTALGHRTSDRRPILDRDAIEERLSLEQLRDVIETITRYPYAPMSGDDSRFELFRQINTLDQQYQYNLLPFLADPREYWNNVITLLSVYNQKLVEQDMREELTVAIDFCQAVRDYVDLEQRALYQPHTYNRVSLELIEAELRAQVTGQSIDFYDQGIMAAANAIYLMDNIDRKVAQPDYYLITKALINIGDLYLRMHESTRSLNLEVDYLARATQYYGYVANLDSGISIADPETLIYYSYNWENIRGSIDFNRAQGFLNDRQYAEAAGDLQSLVAIATVKNASLITQRRGERNIAEIISELANVDRALDELEINVETQATFHLAFARMVKADLLLFLADSVKHQLWPNAATEPEVERLAAALLSAQQDLAARGTFRAGELYSIIDLVFHVINAAGAPERTEEIIDNISSLNDLLISQARGLYQSTPSRFAYLYAWAYTKLTEIGVRTGEFMNREFSFLVPFYTDPVLMSHPIPEHEFLGIEQNYLRALLLASSENDREALELLEQVITDANNLNDRYRTYYQVHARLKIAEIYANSDDRGLRNTRAARELFPRIRDQLNTLTETDLREMGWRPDSFWAEFYHEWANLTGTMAYGLQALESCYRSDSLYDLETRRDYILMRFNYHHTLTAFDEELQERYQRRPTNGREPSNP